jgi:hypothetical protein
MVKKLSEFSVGFLISALSYSILFYLNDWLTSNLVFGLGVNWIYLPAGLRLFLTLVFAMSGAVGIAVASFLICWFGDFPQDLTTCLGVGFISGLAPYMARIFVVANVRLAADLDDLNLQKLIFCILINAALSSGLHQWWYQVRGLNDAGTLNHFFVMFIGDVFGTVLLIAVIKCGLDLLRKTRTIVL